MYRLRTGVMLFSVLSQLTQDSHVIAKNKATDYTNYADKICANLRNLWEE